MGNCFPNVDTLSWDRTTALVLVKNRVRDFARRLLERRRKRQLDRPWQQNLSRNHSRRFSFSFFFHPINKLLPCISVPSLYSRNLDPGPLGKFFSSLPVNGADDLELNMHQRIFSSAQSHPDSVNVYLGGADGADNRSFPNGLDILGQIQL